MEKDTKVTKEDVFKLIDEKASRAEVHDMFKEYYKDAKDINEYREVWLNVMKYIYERQPDENEKKEVDETIKKFRKTIDTQREQYDDDMQEAVNMVNEHHDEVVIQNGIDTFSQKTRKERIIDNFNQKVEETPIKIDSNGLPKLDKFQQERYGDAQEYKVTRKSMTGSTKDNVKQVINNSEKVKKVIKTGIVIIISVTLVAISTYAIKHAVNEQRQDNNIFAVYTVQEGENIDNLENEFYKLDIVQRPLEGYELAEYKANYGDNALLEGDKMLVLTNEEILNEKQDNIKLANPEEIKEYYESGKLFNTREAVKKWMEGKSAIEYITGNPKSY